MNTAQRLELNWIGKHDPKNRINPEPRILIEKPEYSYSKSKTEVTEQLSLEEKQDKKLYFDNMLIHGDNLLALKSLELEYAGKIKCIYIDPPYNTGSAFEHYDDNLEHSTWLNLMKPRLELLRNLLSNEGSIWVQIDKTEFAYLSLILDEVFGRNNRINLITIKTKISGVGGGFTGKSLRDTSEYILGYSKNKPTFQFDNVIYEKCELMKFIEKMESENKSWKYTSVLTNVDEGKHIKTIYDGAGDEIKIYEHKNFEILSINEVAKREFNGNLQKAYYKYINKIFQTTNAQSSIRSKIMETNIEDNSELISIIYTPKSGKNLGKQTKLFYKGEKRRLFAWLKDVVSIEEKGIFKLDNLGNVWEDFNYNNLTKEGNVLFPNGKKPEKLIERILTLATNPGDLVLDSFLGSGTTAAVAHKMGRRWIGIELGDHAYTHCYKRLKAVIDGEQGGISKEVNWQGGGGFKFYELAPSLLEKDKFGNPIISNKYDKKMLERAVAKHKGYYYQPDKNMFWKQSQNEDKNFLFVTRNHVTPEDLDYIHTLMKSDEHLLICSMSYEKECRNQFANITIQQIPRVLIGKCDFMKESYSLNLSQDNEAEKEESTNE